MLFDYPRISRLVCATLVLSCCAAQAPAAPKVYVLDSAQAQLTTIDEDTRLVDGTITTGKEPHHLMLTPDHSALVVANSASNSLMLIDPATGVVRRRIEGIEDPYQLAFSPDGDWFVTAGLRLNRVDIYHYDGQSMTLAKRLPLENKPSHLCFSSDSHTVFVSLQESGELAAIDVLSQVVLWRIPVGDTPAGVWCVPGDRYVMVGMTGEDDVAVVDWHTHAVIKRIHSGRGAHNFRALDDGRHVAVSNRVSNTITILDFTTLEKTGEIGGLMAGPDDMELSADHRFMWVTFRFASHVGIIDLVSDKLVATIAVGRSPHGIFISDGAPLTDQ